MRTNIVLDDKLVEEAFRLSGEIKTKRKLVETALKEYIRQKKRKDLSNLRGKIEFADNYNYKTMRENT